MKHTLLPFFLPVFLFFYTNTIQANKEDSLRNVIANTDGVEKLDALMNLMVLKIGEKDAIEYAIMLEEEARKQKNEVSIGSALMSKSTIYASEIDNEKFFPAAEEAMAYLFEKKQFKNYFLTYSNVIKMHLNNGYYETAYLKISLMLEEAKELNDLYGEINVYENMGDAYYVEKYYQKALESFQKVFSLLNIHYPEQQIFRADMGIKIADNAYKTGDMPLTILYCDSVKQIIDEFDRTKSNHMKNFSTRYLKMSIYTFYALAYISVGREKEATDAINMAIEYSEDEVEDGFLHFFYYLCSDFYFKKGDNKIAFDYLNKSQELSSSYEMPDGSFIQMKSKILAAMGNIEDAYKAEREYTELVDSLNQKKLSQRISELRTIHQVEKLEFQAEQERLKTINLRMFIVGLTVIILLLACVIVFIIYNLNKIKQKNRILYQRIQSQEALEMELKRKEEALHTKSFSGNETSDDETDLLYLRLKELMKDEKNYTDPNASRKSLASKLGTNEKYLHETIKKHLDLSFSEYITLLRLDYAREMMSKHARELQLEDIALQSGFGTRQTFHRLFRDRYGLSPSEFSYLLKNS
jgi:Transcriptional regulator containing an amidase domain and an AraC-type DNA-binding HTH domain